MDIQHKNKNNYMNDQPKKDGFIQKILESYGAKKELKENLKQYNDIKENSHNYYDLIGSYDHLFHEAEKLVEEWEIKGENRDDYEFSPLGQALILVANKHHEADKKRLSIALKNTEPMSESETEKFSVSFMKEKAYERRRKYKKNTRTTAGEIYPFSK